MNRMTKKIAASILVLTLCVQLVLTGVNSRLTYAASTPKAAFITSVTSPKSKCMEINWKKVSVVTGYHIQISTKSDFSNTDAIKSIKSEQLEDHVSITGLTNGNTYYVRLRTYVKSNGSTKYSSWSNKGSAKITSAKNSISLSKSSSSIFAGKSVKLKATVTGSSKTVSWKSSNKDVATVSDGKVVGKGKGSCVITAKANGSAAYCKVTVKEVAVKEITLNKTSMTLTAGNTGKLTASISPSNATNQSISWSSSNKEVASVSKGKVTAKKAGKAIITAKSNNGKTATCSITVKGPRIKNVKMVSCGYQHTAILKEDGSLWMTGYNEHGQLGDGITKNKKTPVQIMTDVVSVSCGGNHTAILEEDGSLWMTGWNQYGQLGDGTDKDKSSPVKIMTDVKLVSCGDNHTAILKEDGSLWMTGGNYFGQLGDGTESNKTKPVQIMRDVKSVSSGYNHTAILKNDGSLWLTGKNDCGQLGDGTTKNKKTPVQIMTDVKTVSCGGAFTAIVKTDGSLLMAGENDDGQLGDGTVRDRKTPVQIMTDVVSVSCGYAHTAILKEDGSLWMTGYNYYGQLGDGTSGEDGMKTSPVKTMTDVQSVSCGGHHTAILKDDGSLWMTGYNTYGQLGDGTTKNKKKPE